MNKEEMIYILVWYYHDTFHTTFDSLDELNKFLDRLKKDYKHDRYFRYHVYYGKKLEV